MVQRTRATIDDLYRVPDNAKAELVGGEVVLIPPTGGEPGYAGDANFVSLRAYCRQTEYGRAVGDNKGFVVWLPHRGSFSPSVAMWVGPSAGMKFFDGAPIVAVEVRSEGDYGPKAEEAIVAKRADYFAAGTRVVWDVDVLSDDEVRVYRSSDPSQATVYRRGELAEAEPAAPGWTMPVDDLFDAS